MNVNSLLQDFVKHFYLSKKMDGELHFSEEKLLERDEKLSGQLLEYYQHLSFEGECYFGNRFFNLVFLPYLSEATEPETWALDDNQLFNQKDYMIFAHNMLDEAIFCDVRDQDCPVYSLISGSSEVMKLSNSLFDFLSFYIELTKLQALSFKYEVREQNLKLKKELVDDVYLMINKFFCDDIKENLIEFIF
ncbi:hypothetical protein [Pasteurella sp. PK-2025]|uniref:hypothetical protein n=1 Tax=Pasteurella sp. PK-2025 TaxID=3413133 RepID=UPI003C712790